MFIRAYLRASTTEQDATRAKEELTTFVECHKQKIAAHYIENVSGTKLERPELNRLINDSNEGDILLIEKMDRLTRLPYQEWQTLKGRIKAKGILIVVADQVMTHASLIGSASTNPIQQALTDFMLDLGAAMARDDQETRQKRQRTGIDKAVAEGRYKGKQINRELHNKIDGLLASGVSWSKIIAAVGCSRATVAKVAKQRKENEGLVQQEQQIDIETVINVEDATKKEPMKPRRKTKRAVGLQEIAQQDTE